MEMAHAGGWDLAATCLKWRGQQDFKMVRFEADGLTFEKVIGKEKGQDVARSVFEIREILLQGNLVGLMGDRPVGRHLELVKFFGKLAVMDATPFRIAGICKVPVLFTFGFKVDERSYHFYATPTREYSNQESYPGLCEYAAELERLLKIYPDQWFNFYEFWSVSSGER